MNGTAAERMPRNFHFLLSVLYAPMTDCLVWRPSAVSSSSSETPNVNASTKYVKMNMPPPYLAANVGKRQRFPSPTALAAPAKMNPSLPDHAARSCSTGNVCFAMSLSLALARRRCL